MVMPLSDDNSDRTIVPVVNIALIVVNVLVFVFFQGMGTNDDFTLTYSTVPAEILSGKDVVTEPRRVEVTLGNERQIVTIPGLKRTPIPVYLTIFTAMFMHGGLAHIAGNMWFLWIFGDNIEQDLGRVRYLIFYLLCGVLATLTHVFVSSTGPSATTPSLRRVGAISGVMGAYLVMHTHRRVTVLLFRIITEVPAYVAVGLWFAFQVISGLGVLGGGQGGVAYGAHIGGFIAGMALVKVFTLGKSNQQPESYGHVGGRSYKQYDP